MCLDKVTRFPSPESLLEERTGWVCRMGSATATSCFTHPKGFGFSHWNSDGYNAGVRKPAWGLAHISPVVYGEVGDSPFTDLWWMGLREAQTYPSGFHVFINKEDAESYRAGLRYGLTKGDILVLPVRGRGILAEGIQSFYSYPHPTKRVQAPCFVALELEEMK